MLRLSGRKSCLQLQPRNYTTQFRIRVLKLTTGVICWWKLLLLQEVDSRRLDTSMRRAGTLDGADGTTTADTSVDSSRVVCHEAKNSDFVNCYEKLGETLGQGAFGRVYNTRRVLRLAPREDSDDHLRPPEDSDDHSEDEGEHDPQERLPRYS